VEITEATSVDDYERFEELIRHYVGHGFRVALDDFGAGHSGFVTLVAMTPHFIKLDRAIIAGIESSSYKQHLVKSVASFATSVETSLIAEGVETAEELATVFRLGVRYAQGYYVCPPQPEPATLSDPVRSRLADLERQAGRSRSFLGDRLSRLAVRPATFPRAQLTGESLDQLFRGNHSLDHVVLVEGERPMGIITRQHFYSIIGGRFGYCIYQKKPVDLLAKRDFLAANDRMDLRDLGKRAMERSPADLYDPVVVVDDRERLIGTITMKQLLSKAMDIELKIAMSSNPLTQLPGNLIIEYWIDEAVAANEFVIAYADLSNFKEFNDIHGFAQGDELIRVVARILQRHTPGFADGAKLGHIGGDDFVIVAAGGVYQGALQAIRDEFDAERLRFFPQEDIQRGYYIAENRRGAKARIPLLALGIGVIDNNNFRRRPHPGRLAQAATLLKPRLRDEIRRTGRSTFLFERRTYD
jgi:GGDEF domain-containing protein